MTNDQGKAKLFRPRKGGNVDSYQFDVRKTGQAGQVVAGVEEGGIMEDDENFIGGHLGQGPCEVIGVAPDAGEVVLDVTSVNADA
jgi:hypothetical protein